jgi:hypothetical protein
VAYDKAGVKDARAPTPTAGSQQWRSRT